MRNIMVSTDFSPGAHVAVLFAATLARQVGARLILFHAYYPAVLLEEDTIWADTAILETEVQEKMDKLAHELHNKYKLSITRLLKPGFPVDEILELSKKVKADLLILGTDGSGKRLKTGPGKIAAEVMKKATLPVLCVPPGLQPGAEVLPQAGSDVVTLTGNQACSDIFTKLFPTGNYTFRLQNEKPLAENPELI